MLSYQHIYHAGNLADVQKHALMSVLLDYMTRKPKPLTYLETHSGRGVYHLDAEEAQKTAEARAGILPVNDWFGADHPYARVIAQTRNDLGVDAYPGSPALAAALLRPEDTMHLAELHPQEHQALDNALGLRARVYRQDGFEMAQSICPPEPRRGVLLIDPSYEVKSDYDKLPGLIGQLHRKWNVGVIALWYPILTNGSQAPMVKKLRAAGFPKMLSHEVSFPPVREGHRMVGSGMFIINAPFGLEQEAKRLTQCFAKLKGVA
jgi:23S rRNA (adenine2030-N6)-methyltransferase